MTFDTVMNLLLEMIRTQHNEEGKNYLRACFFTKKVVKLGLGTVRKTKIVKINER